MLGKREKRVEVPQEEERVLEITASMQGSLSFKDPVNILINGDFEGELDTLGKLTVGESATVRAKISGESIIVRGEVIGDLTVSRSLFLSSKARLIGDVQTPSLSMEPGAVMQGQVSMISLKQKPRREANKDSLNVDELAEYLSVEKAMVFEWADSGKLPGVYENSSWRFDKKKVDEWVASGKIK